MNLKATLGSLMAAGTLVIAPLATANTNAVSIDNLKVVAEKGDSKAFAGKANWHEEWRRRHHEEHHRWHREGRRINADKAANYPSPAVAITALKVVAEKGDSKAFAGKANWHEEWRRRHHEEHHRRHHEEGRRRNVNNATYPSPQVDVKG